MPSYRPFRRGHRAVLATFVLAQGLVALVAFARPASSQTPPPEPELEALRRQITELRNDYEARLAALEQQLAELEARPQPTPPPPAQTQTATYFNPAISLIGNFLAVGGQGRGGDLPSADLRESEIGLQAIVDPYARADFFFSYGEQGVEVEEGFLTLTSLPWQLLVKIGRTRTQFGKVNTLHLHVLPWPDEPLPVVDLLGGEEGWIGTGLTVGRLIPLGETFSELTLQVMRGDSDGLFSAEKPSDLAWNAHYRVFRDLGDSSNLDVGFSYGFGPNGSAENAETRLQGLDLTYRWKPLQQGLYRSVILRGELYRSENEQPEGLVDALGWFVSGDVQLAKRWWAGGRYEWSERALDADLRETGEALLLTWNPSEFFQLRGELRRRQLAEGFTRNDFLLQVQFALGAHGAHPF